MKETIKNKVKQLKELAESIAEITNTIDCKGIKATDLTELDSVQQSLNDIADEINHINREKLILNRYEFRDIIKEELDNLSNDQLLELGKSLSSLTRFDIQHKGEFFILTELLTKKSIKKSKIKSITYEDIIYRAELLISEDYLNTEYDRALIELISDCFGTPNKRILDDIKSIRGENESE